MATNKFQNHYEQDEDNVSATLCKVAYSEIDGMIGGLNVEHWTR